MTHLRCQIGILLFALLTSVSLAQTPQELAKLDPEELYFQAWSLTKDGEDAERKGDYMDAFSAYQKALTFFDVVRIYHRRHKPDLVLNRCARTTKAMEKIHDQALAEQQAKQDQEDANPLIEIAEPGLAIPATKSFAIPDRRDASARQTKRIESLQNQVDNLEKQLARTNRRTAASARLARELTEAKEKLSEEAAKPFKNQIRDLNRQIASLRGEKDAMERARNLARKAERAALAKLKTAQSDLAQAKADIAQREAIIAKQTKTNNKVVQGQLDQIDTLKELLITKDEMIGQANQRVKDFEKQLAQSEAMFNDLAQERNALLEERDQLTALLSVNEADRVQDLITQNVGLSRQLNEAQENLKMVQNESNASKEKILLAKQALTVAKAKIQNLQKENERANRRLVSLKTNLEQAKSDLLAQLNEGSLNQRGKEEVAMLRKVIAKQEAALAAHEGTAQLILEEANRMGEKDDRWKEAVELVKGVKKIELSDDEQDLLYRTGGSVVLNSNISTPGPEYQRATSELRSFTRSLNKVASRLFAKGDFQAARGNFELVIEEDPGAWEAMMNLGIIHLRMDDPSAAISQFQQAILVAGDRKIPFAHFILGEAFYHQKLYEEADREIRLSLSYQPQNPEAHIILGSIAGQKSDLKKAAFHFEEALEQDPTLPQPYYNMAIIHYKEGRKDEARKSYQNFLKNGGSASPDLEKMLNT